MQIITCFFNPAGFLKPVANMKRMLKLVEEQTDQSVQVVELSFTGEQEIPGSYLLEGDIERNVCWQKEALLNYAAYTLNPDADSYCWLDADVMFSNPNWYAETVHLLNTYKVVQPFSTVSAENDDRVYASFACTYQFMRNPTWESKPGYAFAWKAEAGPLPELGIIGGGDRITWCAATGDMTHPVMSAFNQRWKEHLFAQCAPMIANVNKSIGVTGGHLKYMTHGTHENRKYNERFSLVKDFNPAKHIVKDGPIYAWTDEGIEYNSKLFNYFCERCEDDE